MNAEERKAKRREYQRMWREKNRDKKREHGKAWREKNPEYLKAWREKNPDYMREYNREWRGNNRERYRELKRKLSRKYQRNNPFARLVRTNLKNIIQRNTKNSKYTVYFGCSCQELREHLLSLLPVGVTLANFGALGYSLDHIVPFKAFNNLDNLDHPECEEERKLVAHYLNLQVIKLEENQTKATSFEPADIEALKKKVGESKNGR